MKLKLQFPILVVACTLAASAQTISPGYRFPSYIKLGEPIIQTLEPKREPGMLIKLRQLVPASRPVGAPAGNCGFIRIEAAPVDLDNRIAKSPEAIRDEMPVFKGLSACPPPLR